MLLSLLDKVHLLNLGYWNLYAFPKAWVPQGVIGVQGSGHLAGSREGGTRCWVAPSCKRQLDIAGFAGAGHALQPPGTTGLPAFSPWPPGGAPGGLAMEIPCKD